jgi:hypothetical protein
LEVGFTRKDKTHVAVIVGTVVPLVLMLKTARRRSG